MNASNKNVGYWKAVLERFHLNNDSFQYFCLIRIHMDNLI